MIDAATRALLQWAVEYIDGNNQRAMLMHKHIRTGEIEPASVRQAVAAANKWLERVRRLLKSDALPANVNPPPPPGPPPPAPSPPRLQMNQVSAVVEDFSPAESINGSPLKIGVANKAGGQVRLNLGARPITWAELDPQQAADLSSMLMRSARYAADEIGLSLRVRP